MDFVHSMLTDRNGEFDAGAILVVLVTLYMCASSGYDTFVQSRAFNAQEFGMGIAAMLGGFGVYKWGDSRRPYDRRPLYKVDIPDDR